MTRSLALGALLLFLLPLVTHGAWWLTRDHPRSWAHANWSSAGILKPAPFEREAVVHVMAGRTGRWKGIFAHHSWIVIKERDAQRYTRYEVVGWGRALRIDSYAPDGRWYGNTPEILLTLKGAAADRGELDTAPRAAIPVERDGPRCVVADRPRVVR